MSLVVRFWRSREREKEHSAACTHFELTDPDKSSLESPAHSNRETIKREVKSFKVAQTERTCGRARNFEGPERQKNMYPSHTFFGPISPDRTFQES